MTKEVFAELYVCWKCGNVSVDCNACEDCGGEMEFTYFVPESPPKPIAADVAKALSEKTVVAKFKKGKLVSERVISPCH